MDQALSRLRISGIATTAAFHRAVIAHPDFQQGRVTTDWLERRFMPGYAPPQRSEAAA